MCLAIPGQVIEIVDEREPDRAGRRRGRAAQRERRAARGDGRGRRAGDWVLIHVGFALSKVDEEEAQATLGLLQRMGEAYEQELEDLKASAIE